jgi:hypothetical protein
MLPEVQAYVNSLEADIYAEERAVEREFTVPRWSVSLSKEEREEYYEAVEKRDVAMRELRRERLEREATAFEGLANSDNPMVRWIATTDEVWNDYRSYADRVLQALPMTREEIDDFGNAKGWCGEYGRLLRMAEAAGVLPEPEPELADIEPLVQEFIDWWGSGSESTIRRMIKKHLPVLIESAKQREAAA